METLSKRKRRNRIENLSKISLTHKLKSLHTYSLYGDFFTFRLVANSNQIYNHFLEHQLVSTDSRKISKNCVFFALRGDNFNGNIYALDAIKKGASFAIVDEDIDPKEERLLLVDDVLVYLQQFANRYRSEFDIPVIAITGSNGKTTTKELMAAVLSAKYSVHFTKGNFNNHIGVPLTLLQLTEEHEIAIIEMGANHKKEIDLLCEIANPTHGLITNIGKAHLEGFGGVEGVKIGKGELFDFLGKNGGVAFINHNEKSVTCLLESRALRQVDYSMTSKEQGFVDLEHTNSGSMLSFNLHFYNDLHATLNTNLSGLYNSPNILNAISIGIYFKVSSNKIIQQIEEYKPTNNRSQVLQKGTNTFLLDAYNANPSSMKVAIENFAIIPHPQKIAILGDMYELGEYSHKEHLEIARIALEGGFTKVIFVGKHFPNPTFANVYLLKEWFATQKWENTYFLLKGSRGIALEKLLD